MEPLRDTKGRQTLDRQRNPGDVDEYVPLVGVVVSPGPVYGPWDVDADDTIQKATEGILGSGGLHGRRGNGSPDVALVRSVVSESGAGAAGENPDERPVDRDLSHTGQPGDAASPDGSAGRGRQLTKAQRRARVLTQRALALRVAGWEIRDIAHHFGVTPTTITGWFTSHRRHVQIEDVNAQLDQIAVPLATENLIHGLLAGDKDYTLETLKGRGQLRRHGETDAKPPTHLPELVIRFEAAGHESVPTDLVGGKVLGTASVPKTIDGVVVASETLDGDDHVGVGHVQIPRAAAPPASPDGRGEVPSS